MSKLSQKIKKWLTKEVKQEESNGQQLIEDQDSLVYGKMLRREIPGTPFHIMGDGQTGYALTIGMNRLSPMLDDQNDVHAWLADNAWNVTMTLVIMAMDSNNDMGKAIQDSITKTKTAK